MLIVSATEHKIRVTCFCDRIDASSLKIRRFKKNFFKSQPFLPPILVLHRFLVVSAIEIARSTIQVVPGGWMAILVYLDNVGVWNLRALNLDRWYLGQETYMRIVNPEDDGQKSELPPPDNVLFCGALGHLQKPQTISFAAVSSI